MLRSFDHSTSPFSTVCRRHFDHPGATRSDLPNAPTTYTPCLWRLCGTGWFANRARNRRGVPLSTGSARGDGLPSLMLRRGRAPPGPRPHAAASRRVAGGDRLEILEIAPIRLRLRRHFQCVQVIGAFGRSDLLALGGGFALVGRHGSQIGHRSAMVSHFRSDPPRWWAACCGARDARVAGGDRLEILEIAPVSGSCCRRNFQDLQVIGAFGSSGRFALGGGSASVDRMVRNRTRNRRGVPLSTGSAAVVSCLLRRARDAQ
jgi:hypothetical protein